MDAVTTKDTAQAMRQYQRKSQELAFERTIKEYVLDNGSKYQFGGVLNLIWTVRKVLEQLSDEQEADYHGVDFQFMAFAAEQVKKAEEAVDVPYGWKP